MISWSCKSSVMEMTKNRMIRAQLIATIFRQLLAGRLGRAGQDRLLHSNPIPTIATNSQTRFSASSMLSKVSYAPHSADAIAFPFLPSPSFAGQVFEKSIDREHV